MKILLKGKEFQNSINFMDLFKEDNKYDSILLILIFFVKDNMIYLIGIKNFKD